jgi:hypothetical protein
MVASLVGAGCCFLLVPFAVVAGVWTTLAALGETSSPGGVPVGPGVIATLGNTVGLLFAVAVLDGLTDRFGADA